MADVADEPAEVDLRAGDGRVAGRRPDRVAQLVDMPLAATLTPIAE